MNTAKTSILLIEDNVIDAKLIQDAFANGGKDLFSLEWVTQLSDALIRLAKIDDEHKIDVVLLDLTLPDGQGVEAFDKVFHVAPSCLILVMSTESDEESVREIMKRGAHDYFSKGHVDAYWLPRALRYVAERKAAELILHAAEEDLFEEKERVQITLNSIGDSVLTTDLLGNVTYMNRVAETMTGWQYKDAVGKPFSDIFNVVNGETREVIPNLALAAISKNTNLSLPLNSVLIRRDGSELEIEDSTAPIHKRNGQSTGAVIVFHDVSESRNMVLKMAHLAQHDFLTGLANRLLLTERLCRAMGLAQRNLKQVGLLFLDLDHFKHINDSLGHAIGDQLLQSVAARLLACVRTTDTVCRQGGDEFVILLTEIERAEDASFTAEKLLAAFTAPHVIDNHELYISLSIGISVFPNDGNTVECLMKNADAAMYHAKSIGRNNCQFFKEEMNTQAVKRLFLEASLRRALRCGEFVLYYQPKIDLTSGAIIGAEALIRWKDPELGLIYPTEFIAVAEECGLIVPIGRWVLREACSQVQRWLAEGLRVVPVAVNISAVELRHKYFLDGVAQILKETNLPPQFLEMELTETILMHDAELSITILQALKTMGIQLAIDDFGTGYSSLSYLRRFPVDTLKIDQSFVREIDTDASNATIVSAVIGMGRNLKQRVIAEGVETAEQYVFLRSQQCDEGQGFHFSHPLPADDFAYLLGNELTQISARSLW